MLPRIVPVEDEEVSKELERVFKKQGIRVETGAKAENIQQDRQGREAHRDAGRRQDRRHGGRLAADRGRTQAEHRQYRPREHASVELDRGFIKVDAVPADRRAGRLRDRRRRGGHAATGARGDDGRHGRARPHAGQAGDADQSRTASRARRTPSRASAASGMTEAQAKAQGLKSRSANSRSSATAKRRSSAVTTDS